MTRMVLGLSLVLSFCATAQAQDVPGIEICTVDKTWERRTSCLQSNVDYLVKIINRMKSDQDLKLDAANRQIEAQKNAIVALQKVVADIQGAKKTDAATPAKDAPAAKSPPAPSTKDTPAAK